MRKWAPIKSFTISYHVSSDGLVRNIRSGRILKPRPDNDGYLHVSLFARGHIRYATVHALVAEAFLGRKPPYHQINHKDGNKKNNRHTNLEWRTGLRNMEHAKAMGLCPRGADHGMAKLSERNVLEIRRRHASRNLIRKELAEKFGVTVQAITAVIKRKSWDWLK